jgi:hypothetical protein
MPNPMSVYELLGLLTASGGQLPLSDIPEHLKPALSIALTAPGLVHVPFLGLLNDVGPRAYLTTAGRADLARHDEPSGSQRADGTPPDKQPPPEESPELSLDARALALFIADTRRKKTDIAKLLRLRNSQSLAPKRCPKLSAAMRAHRAADPDRRRVRGSKDREGNLEAYREDEGE